MRTRLNKTLATEGNTIHTLFFAYMKLPVDQIHVQVIALVPVKLWANSCAFTIAVSAQGEGLALLPAAGQGGRELAGMIRHERIASDAAPAEVHCARNCRRID